MDTQNVPTSVVNARILEDLERGETKTAQDAGSEYTRTSIREESFAFQLLPPEKATNDMLDRALDERLQIIWELEPDSPGAKWVPLQEIPDGEYITGSRYVIPFARVLTPKNYKDVDELRTYRQDLRKILTDNNIKDGLATIDGKFIETVNSIVFDASGGEGTEHNETGKVQWLETSEELNRSSFAEAKKLLPRGNSSGQFRCRNYACLMNDTTAQNWLKLDRAAVGGDLAEDFFKNGLTTDTFMGVKSIFTVKDDLVPDNWVYFFAAPEYLGKCFYFTDWTMFMKKEAYFIEWFSYWFGGFAIGNIAGVALCKFGV